MANRFAVANGDFNDTATWSDTAAGSPGASVPTTGDNAIANNRTVQITTNVTCDALYNTTLGGATTGGTFQCSTAGVTITAECPANATAALLTISNATGTVYLVGNVTGGTVNTGCVVISGAGAVDITGNCTGPAGAANGAHGVRITGAATVTIVGDVTGTSGNSNAEGVSIENVSAVVSVTGSVTGGSAGTGNGIEATALATLRVTGTITATNTAPGVYTLAGTNYFTGPFICSADGTSAIVCRKWLWDASVPASYMNVRTETSLTIKPLYTADSVGGNPAEADVREGTVYGPASELEGTLAVPPVESVGFGVPVDNTTGTASLTAAAIRAALGMASADLDTQIGTLATASALSTVEGKIDTVDGVADAIKAKTDQLAFTVANQVDANALTGGLDAAGVRSAVGLASANLDTQLGAIDTVVDSILVDTDDTIPALIDALPTAAETVTELMDAADTIETGLTFRNAQRLQAAAAAGKLSGANTTTVTIRNAVADGVNRIVATVDEHGNRTAITTDLS
jgi:hypothetical protein